MYACMHVCMCACVYLCMCARVLSAGLYVRAHVLMHTDTNILSTLTLTHACAHERRSTDHDCDEGIDGSDSFNNCEDSVTDSDDDADDCGEAADDESDAGDTDDDGKEGGDDDDDEKKTKCGKGDKGGKSGKSSKGGDGAARGARKVRMPVKRYNVFAVFGIDKKRQAVWLYVKSVGQKVQYLKPAAGGGGLWTVLAPLEDQNAVVRMQWKNTAFHVSGTGRNQTTTTVSPLDGMAALRLECKVHGEQERSEESP
jgi:hypothetical protein